LIQINHSGICPKNAFQRILGRSEINSIDTQAEEIRSSFFRGFLRAGFAITTILSFDALFHTNEGIKYHF
jgi:hypothetical protein